MFQEKFINCLIWCHFTGKPRKIPLNCPLNPPPSRQISNWTPSGVLSRLQLGASDLTFDFCTHYLTNLSSPLRKKTILLVICVWYMHLTDCVWWHLGMWWSHALCTDRLRVCSADRLKARSAKRHTCKTLQCHRCRKTHTKLINSDGLQYFQSNNTDICVCMPKCTYTYTHVHVHTHTPTSVAAYRNTDGHRPATSVSPSVNPCETDSNPSTGHTDAAIIPLNKLIQDRRRLPQAVGMAAHIWYTSGAYRLLVNCCYSASVETQKRHLQNRREVKQTYMCEWLCECVWSRI